MCPFKLGLGSQFCVACPHFCGDIYELLHPERQAAINVKICSAV